MMRVLSVFGTRPEAIKMAPVIRSLAEYPTQVENIICSTGQHRDMLQQTLDVLAIHPQYNLDIMTENQDLYDVIALGLIGLRNVIYETQPDWLLVHGDTMTTLAASLAASLSGIRIGHVEAGLRSYHKFSPFPEEINRRVIDVLADAYFVPTAASRDNLLREGVEERFIHKTGNTAIDTLMWMYDQIKTHPPSVPELSIIDWERRMILVTAHRRESFGKGIRAICLALKRIAQLYPDINIVFPAHLNPNVRMVVSEILSGISNIYVIPPQRYDKFVWLISKSTLILTDSGGIQEEAPVLNIPVLVMRKVTERTEGLATGAAQLVGIDSEAIVHNVRTLLEDEHLYAYMANAPNPYGDGRAASRIVDVLLKNTREGLFIGEKNPG